MNESISATVPVTLYLDRDTKQRLDSLRIHGFTVNGFIRAAIDEHLKRLSDLPSPEHVARLVSGV